MRRIHTWLLVLLSAAGGVAIGAAVFAVLVATGPEPVKARVLQMLRGLLS